MFITNMQVGEEVRIGDNVRVVVMRTERGHVKLGLDAPKDVKLVRGSSPPPEKDSAYTGQDVGEASEDPEEQGNSIQSGREERLWRYYGVRSG